MIANISVITDNLDYLLWGRVAEGQPGGVLLTLLMAIGAALLALPGGIILACCAWRFPGAVRNGLFIWAEFIRGIPLIFVIFWMWYLLPMLTGSVEGEDGVGGRGDRAILEHHRAHLLPGGVGLGVVGIGRLLRQRRAGKAHRDCGGEQQGSECVHASSTGRWP